METNHNRINISINNTTNKNKMNQTFQNQRNNNLNNTMNNENSNTEVNKSVSIIRKKFKPKRVITNILYNTVLNMNTRYNDISNSDLNNNDNPINSYINNNNFREKKSYEKIRNYNPHKSHTITTVSCTSSSIILLTNQGTLCSWGQNNSALGRRIIDSKMDCYKPMIIKCSEKIIAIQCGYSHVLSLSKNGKIFSWGNNEYGQLGIQGLPLDINAERDEPYELTVFDKIPISSIYAQANSSFCITELANNLYGWGDNSQNQLGFYNPSNKNGKVGTPTLIENISKCQQEYLIKQSRNGKATYCIFLMKPSNKILQSMIYFNNKYFYMKEEELKNELVLIKEQLRSYSSKKALDYLKTDPLAAKECLKRIMYFTKSIEKKIVSLNSELTNEENINLIHTIETQHSTNNLENLDEFLDDIYNKAEQSVIDKNFKNSGVNSNSRQSKLNNLKIELVHYKEILEVSKLVLNEGEKLLLKQEKRNSSFFNAFLNRIQGRVNNLMKIDLENTSKKSTSLSEIYLLLESMLKDLEKNSKEYLPDKKDSSQVNKNVGNERSEVTQSDYNNTNNIENLFIEKTKDLFNNLLQLKKSNLNLRKKIIDYSDKSYESLMKELIKSSLSSIYKNNNKAQVKHSISS